MACTSEAIVNSSEIAAREYGSAVENPLTLWDLHWLTELDDEAFIDDVVSRLDTRSNAVIRFFCFRVLHSLATLHRHYKRCAQHPTGG